MTDQVDKVQMKAGGQDLAAVIDRQWPDAQWDAVPLDGGMTNRNWKVTVGAGPDASSYAVQLLLSDAAAEHIGINRETHAKAMVVVDELELGPKLVAWHRDQPKAIISEYVACAAPETAADRLHTAQLTADALHVLHTRTTGADLPNWLSDPFSGVDWLYEKASDAAPDLAARFDWAMEINRRCQRARGKYPMCLAHSDLSVGNVLAYGSRVYFIDWEYAGLGDRYYDCADFVEKWDLRPEELHAFVERYRKAEPYDYVNAVISMYRFTARLREGLWAANTSVVNFIDFDHVGYAKECLARLTVIADDRSFDEAVRTVDAARTER